MKFPRTSGILLHPTSLPGRFGIGDFGPEAFRFADFLAAAGQKIWQVLPLVPTGYGESPYASLSSFAGNPLLISPEKLVEHGYLSSTDIASPPQFSTVRCDFEHALPYRYGLLDQALSYFRPTREYADFVSQNRSWLESCARFLALKKANGGVAWTDWKIADPDPKEVEKQKFWQFEFSRQWSELKAYCAARDIRIFGDIPIYVAHDSADVWANPELFELDDAGLEDPLDPGTHGLACDALGVAGTPRSLDFDWAKGRPQFLLNPHEATLQRTTAACGIQHDKGSSR